MGENVRDALVQILRTDIKGFDLGWSSISEVEVAPDLHYARVFITGLDEEATKKKVEELREVAGQVRHHLGRRIHLRYTPELDFRYDETAMRALRIETILREVMPPKSDEEGDAQEEGEVQEDGEGEESGERVE
ncbi:MAG TPA: 30S ribosome-binding factor RbfA [Thermoanaerobaculia bacterium]